MGDILTETVDAIERLTVEKGYPPTVRELGDALGLSSSSSVAKRLEACVAAGLIVRGPSPRAIRIVRDFDGVGNVARGSNAPTGIPAPSETRP